MRLLCRHLLSSNSASCDAGCPSFPSRKTAFWAPPVYMMSSNMRGQATVTYDKKT